ncbi:DUF3043 domain-containing protein [Glaciihabitans arcticus]|uniref:DUF3043 domain-containing protein n=1 Tax=Glaciihabitans arcticus TaxID=2668039 RepID=A0A4Q9GR87_9MICO|nr:DUF3043 domain-containing protein [Glaciihabitans arcticus]TBN56564.1 DUF3043 domain-containing protein [Glaciihabitans arcticus]
MAKNTQGTSNDEPSPDLTPDTLAGKGRPTPTRKEVEAARKRPLVTNDRAEGRKVAKAAMQIEREKQRIGYSNGVEKYMPLRDRGAQKRFIRDYVDARTSVGEFMLPILVVIIILSVFPQPEIALITIVLLWLFLLVAAVDIFFLGRSIRKRLGEKFGVSKVESGVRWYAGVRAMQLRQMRLPKPQQKRGDWPS